MKLTRTPVHRLPKTGRSTVQLMATPLHGLYIVPTLPHTPYMRQLAKHLGRDDIIISAVSDYHTFEGTDRDIRLDHLCHEHQGSIYWQQMYEAVKRLANVG
jgi:hypothetical protein